MYSYIRSELIESISNTESELQVPVSEACEVKRKDLHSFTRTQKIAGSTQLKKGEWYGIVRSKDVVVKDKNGKDVETCHESLIIGQVVVKSQPDGTEVWSFEGKMYEMNIQNPREHKKTYNLERDLPAEEDETKYKYTKFKGLLPGKWRDFAKIKAEGQAYLDSMPKTWSWEENNCQMYQSNLWDRIQK